MKNRPKIPFEAIFWADMCPNHETWVQQEIWRISLAYLVIQGFQKSFIGPKQGGKIDFFYKMTANTFIWYFFMSVYESKSLNVDSRKHFRSTTNCSKNVGASKMHFQVKKGSKYTFMQKNGKKLLTHANLYVFKLCNLYV